MSEDTNAISVLRRELRDLSQKSDRQHAENRESQDKDREAFRNALQTQQNTFSDSMTKQRELFQNALNSQLEQHRQLERTVDQTMSLMKGCVGDGQPGSGRVGALEDSMEIMKKFRWQALAVIMTAMWVLEVVTHHGH